MDGVIIQNSRNIITDSVTIAVGNNSVLLDYDATKWDLISAIQINANQSVAGNIRSYVDNNKYYLQSDTVQVSGAVIKCTLMQI